MSYQGVHVLELPPKRPGGEKVRLDGVRSVVIIGANGSGKTRIGTWIEQTLGARAHRLTAQRMLSLPSFVEPRTYEQAEFSLLYGNYNPTAGREQQANAKFSHRWGGEPSISLINDFQHVLALLFADEAKRNANYARAARTMLPTERPPSCKLDVLLEIWSSVMPQRALTMSDGKIEAKAGNGGTYEARQMSDGERVTIYLIGQALCAPKGAVFIIDEPEPHIHQAIQAALWDKIEAARPDCTFVYLTHDLHFAATRTHARKIWLKEFDGAQWVWEEVEPCPALPDELLFHVLGSRRPLLFVEGDETSYDAAIYTALYPRELVVARQSCHKVVEATKAMSGLSGLHHLTVRGLVDRDRRGDEEVAALRSAGVLVAEVAEVENLLCLPEALEAVAKHLNFPDVPGIKAAAEGAVLDELAKAIDQQALSRALAEIQFRLNGFGPKIGRSDVVLLEADLEKHVRAIEVGVTVRGCRKIFEEIVSRKDYGAALRFYNNKGIIAFVTRSLGISKEVYSQIILGILKAEPDGTVAKAMRKVIEG